MARVAPHPLAHNLPSATVGLDAVAASLDGLTVLAGPSGWERNTVARALALRALDRDPGLGVVVACMDRTPAEYRLQIAAAGSGVPLRRLQRDQLTDEECRRVDVAWAEFAAGAGRRLRFVQPDRHPWGVTGHYSGRPLPVGSLLNGRRELLDQGVRRVLAVVDELMMVGTVVPPAPLEADDEPYPTEAEFTRRRFHVAERYRMLTSGACGPDPILVVTRTYGKRLSGLEPGQVPGGGRVVQAADTVYLLNLPGGRVPSEDEYTVQPLELAAVKGGPGQAARVNLVLDLETGAVRDQT